MKRFYTGRIGLLYLWYKIKDSFLASNPTITAGDVGKVATWDSGGKSLSVGYSLGKDVPADAAFTDTKNTTGATNSANQLYIVGAAEQSANPQTYTNSNIWINSGKIHSASLEVANSNNNVLEVENDGDTYLYGIGGYDGTNASSADTLQSYMTRLEKLAKAALVL